MQLALPKLLEIGAGIRHDIQTRVARNLAWLQQQIGPASPCTLLPSEAGWSVIVRVPETMSDEDWALQLVRDDGVLVQPGYFFDLRLGATLVLSLLTPPQTFEHGVGCILAAAGRI